MLWTKFRIAKLGAQRVTEFHVKKYKFFPFQGVKGGPIKLTLLIGGLDNLTRKLLTNFETNKLRAQRVTDFHVKKYKILHNKMKIYPLFGGLIQLTQLTQVEGNYPQKPYTKFKISKLRTQRVSEFHVKKYTFFPFYGEGGVQSN